jgi:broad specificity phosphatase PhoE
LEAHGADGAEQDVSILTARCVEMASTLGFSEAALDQTVGILSPYIGTKLTAVNSSRESGMPSQEVQLDPILREIDRGS